jgi:TonB family protein
MLNQAAIEAVMQWKFRPAKQRDVPVPVRIVVPIRFTLTG